VFAALSFDDVTNATLAPPARGFFFAWSASARAFPDGSTPDLQSVGWAARRLSEPIEPMTLGNMRANSAVWNDSGRVTVASFTFSSRAAGPSQAAPAAGRSSPPSTCNSQREAIDWAWAWPHHPQQMPQLGPSLRPGPRNDADDGIIGPLSRPSPPIQPLQQPLRLLNGQHAAELQRFLAAEGPVRGPSLSAPVGCMLAPSFNTCGDQT
jgi:hypothetical protein